MATRWCAEEHKTLESFLEDGVELNLLKKYLPNRTDNALQRKAQKYGYGVNTINGIKKLYINKKTRVHKKNGEDTNKVVGGIRVTTNNSAPTTSEQITENVSDDIVSDSAHNINKDAFMHLYADIGKMLNSELYALTNITVTLEDSVFTVSRGAI